MEKQYEVTIHFFSYVTAETEEDAIKKFMEANNINSNLDIYCEAQEAGE